MRLFGGLLSVAAILCVFANPAHAGPITVDGVIFPHDASSPGDYIASVSMSWDNGANELTIELANTSTGLQAETADNLLTGLAFKLPELPVPVTRARHARPLWRRTRGSGSLQTALSQARLT